MGDPSDVLADADLGELRQPDRHVDVGVGIVGPPAAAVAVACPAGRRDGSSGSGRRNPCPWRTSRRRRTRGRTALPRRRRRRRGPGRRPPRRASWQQSSATGGFRHRVGSHTIVALGHLVHLRSAPVEARSGLDPWARAELPAPADARTVSAGSRRSGPASSCSASSIGSGEFLLGPATFVRHGLSLLWVVGIAVLAADDLQHRADALHAGHR